MTSQRIIYCVVTQVMQHLEKKLEQTFLTLDGRDGSEIAFCQQECRSLLSIEGNNLQFYPNFQHWGG